MRKKLNIGITDCSKWENYAGWFRRVPFVDVFKLSCKTPKDFETEFHRCDGVILSGGEDVHPEFYNKPEFLSILKPEEISVERDEFELNLIENCLKLKKPLFGICRGLQIANVFFGGTLIPDIPAAGKPSHSKRAGYDQSHLVNIFDASLLKKLIKSRRGEVNSAHHQAADSVGKELKVTAVSDDGIIEGLEWKDPTGKSFLLLVQWHPERMNDADSPFSKNLRDGFLNASGSAGMVL